MRKVMLALTVLALVLPATVADAEMTVECVQAHFGKDARHVYITEQSLRRAGQAGMPHDAPFPNMKALRKFRAATPQ
jgi:hypothetical protein